MTYQVLTISLTFGTSPALLVCIMSAIKEISNAIGYDLPESILASGGSLADALRAAIMVQDMASFEADPVSVRVHNDAKGDAATIAPKGK